LRYGLASMSASHDTTKSALPRPPSDDEAASTPPSAEPSSPSFVRLSHGVLFEEPATDQCDVCGATVSEDDDDGYAVPGRGLYVWSRGEERRFDEPPLCPSCAAAVGLSAMARWEIEEEEG